MNDDRSAFGRTGVLDIILGALIALSLGDLVTHFQTAAVVLNFASLSRFAVFAGTILFAVLFWIERRELIARYYSGSSRGQSAFPLLTVLHLGMIAVVAVVLNFAAPETFGWFLGAFVMFWAIELIVAVALRGYDRKRFAFQIGYASSHCALFAILTTWNSITPWSQPARIMACLLFPLLVVLGEVVWRPRALVRGDVVEPQPV
ncbi:MAG TPA: hypothetical protein VF701_08175 [Thermoanaerobaculia bacterium]